MKDTGSGYAPVPGHLSAQVRDRPELAPEVPELVDQRVRAAAGLRQRAPRRLAADRARHRRAPPSLRRLRRRCTAPTRWPTRRRRSRSCCAGSASRWSSPARRSRSACCAATGARTCSPRCWSPRATTSSEVCLVFGSKILRGARAVKSSASGFEAFASPNLPPLGLAGVEIEIDVSRLRYAGAGRDRAAARRSTRRSALLRLYPGMPAALLRRGDGGADAKGLVLEAYGAGTVPDADPELLDALAEGRTRRRRHRRQPVRGRPRRPERLRDERAADRGGRGRRPRHDHRGRLHEARRAALRGPRRRTRCAS